MFWDCLSFYPIYGKQPLTILVHGGCYAAAQMKCLHCCKPSGMLVCAYIDWITNLIAIEE